MADQNTPSTKEPTATAGQRVWGVLRFVAHRTFVEPVRRGRMSEDPEFPWPRGIRVLVVIATVLYTALVALSVVGTRLREVTPVVAGGSMSLPVLVILVMIPAIIFGSAGFFVAACHWRHPVRYAIFAALVISYVFASSGIVMLVGAVLALPMIVLSIVRRRARVARWEMPLAVFFFGILTSSIIMEPRDVTPLDALAMLLQFLSWMAYPSVFAAGAAIVEIAVGAASWTARGVWEATYSGSRRAGWTLFALLIVWTLLADVLSLTEGSVEVLPSRLLVALIVVVLVGLVALMIGWLVPMGMRPGVPVDADDVSAAWVRASRPIVMGFAGAYLLGPLIWDAVTFGGLSTYHSLQFVLSIFFLVLAIRAARRGEATTAVILATSAASTFLIQSLNALRVSLVSGQALTLVLDGLTLLILVGLVVARRLTPDRLLAIATAFLLSRFYTIRDWFDEPFTNLFAVSGASAALAVGLIWRQLTEYEFTQRGTSVFRVDARVLLGLGNMLLIGVCILAGTVAGSASPASLDQVEGVADRNIGTTLYLAATLSSLLIAWRGREGGDQRPGEEFGVTALARIEPKATVPAPSIGQKAVDVASPESGTARSPRRGGSG